MRGPRKLDEDPPAPTRDADTAEEVGTGFRRGDPESVRRVAARVRRIVRFRGYGIPSEDRRDLEQQVMTQLWQRIGKGGPAPMAGFWGLVEVVTARRCIDWLRGRRNEAPLDLDPVDLLPRPDARAEDRERQRRALAALKRLPSGCRQLIYLHAGREMSYGEISALLGKSEGTLRVRMHRCLERVRRALAESAGSQPR